MEMVLDQLKNITVLLWRSTMSLHIPPKIFMQIWDFTNLVGDLAGIEFIYLRLVKTNWHKIHWYSLPALQISIPGLDNEGGLMCAWIKLHIFLVSFLYRTVPMLPDAPHWIPKSKLSHESLDRSTVGRETLKH